MTSALPQVKAFVHEGFETNKTFLRRYDTKNEYAIRSDEFEECRRSFLSTFWHHVCPSPPS